MSGPPAAPDRGGEAPRLRLPEPARLFDARAARFAALAEEHAAPEWLRLLSRVAAGQALAVREIRPAAPPVDAGPPLAGAARDGAWRRMLSLVVAASRAPGLPAAAQGALALLADAPSADLEALADGVLGGELPADRLACAPFVGAALQAWLAARAAVLAPSAAGPGPAGACPVCGGPPVAARVRASDRLRYVTCALCASEWYVPRVRCVACDTAAGPEYLHIAGHEGANAEVCPACRTYLKVFDEAKRPGVEPACDDAATIVLDLLVGEEGFHRAGPNLYLGLGTPAAGRDGQAVTASTTP